MDGDGEWGEWLFSNRVKLMHKFPVKKQVYGLMDVQTAFTRKLTK